MSTSNSSRFPPPDLLGKSVGAQRWPEPLHSGLAPWRGTVLALNDKRAWGHTLAFSKASSELAQADIDRHVEWCLQQGLLKRDVPVLWHFDSGDKVYWSDPASLVEYEEDVRRWKLAHEQAKQDLVPLSPAQYEEKVRIWRAEYRQAGPVLTETRREVAGAAYADYEFGDGVQVEDESGWECTTPGDEMSRSVFVSTPEDRASAEASTQLTFTVRFKSGTNQIDDVYARDNKGSDWGHLPELHGPHAASRENVPGVGG